MGNIIYHQGLLLDERDFGDEPHPCMETLTAVVHDYLLDEFELESGFDDDCCLPELELVGLASERFRATRMFYDGYGYSRSVWIEKEGGFNSALLREFHHLDLPDPEAVLHAETGAVGAAELLLQRKICEAVMAARYGYADGLISAVANLREAGLPRILAQCDFERNGDEDLYDFREANYGPGNRILAEISFNWGQ